MAMYAASGLSQQRLVEIRDAASDWALTHGMAVRPSWGSGERGVAVPGPHTLFPSLLPRRLLGQAALTWPHFAAVLHGVARDHDFLESALACVVEADEFTRGLWNIYAAVHKEGNAQPITLCLCRNDFMVCQGEEVSTGSTAGQEVSFATETHTHLCSAANGVHHAVTVNNNNINNNNIVMKGSSLPEGGKHISTSLPDKSQHGVSIRDDDSDDIRALTASCGERRCGGESYLCRGDTSAEKGLKDPTHIQMPASVKASFDTAVLKQIEINPCAAGTAGVCSQLVSLHRLTLRLAGISYQEEQMPYNNPALEMGKAVVQAWRLYGNPSAVVMMVVSLADPYVLDQRLLEFHTYDLDPHIKVIRRTFLDIHERATMTSDRKLWIDGQEVALVYYRRGYAPACYPTDKEWSARLLLERSAAIKCPPIGVQLAGSKKVQQELCRPGALERFLPDQHAAAAVRATFAKLYPLDFTAEGDAAAEMAMASPADFVLKHQRDGGSFNLFRDAVREYLGGHARDPERPALVLMERLTPAWQHNFLVKRPPTPQGLQQVAATFTPDPHRDVTGSRQQTASSMAPVQVVNEIGVYGAYIRRDTEELYTAVCGSMLRTKPLGEDEAGYTKGIAVYDTPFLVD